MTDSLQRLGQAGTENEIEITPEMVQAGLRALRASGVLEYENLVDENLMRRVLWLALAARQVPVNVDSKLGNSLGVASE